MSYLIDLFEQHSYLILFLAIFLELIALPISGEFLMSYAGYFVYQGKMNYLLAILTVFVSGGVGTTFTYWIGKVGGYKLIVKYGKYIHLGPARYKKISAWFERSGSKLLIIAYFIPGIRHFSGYISGISRMPFRKFIIPACIGSFLWGICFITLGKVLGPEWEAFHQAADKYLIIFMIVFVVLVVGYFVYRFYKIQIKNLFIMLIRWLMNRLKTMKKTESFLIFLTFILICMVTLMLGMAQDYLFNDFAKFNEITDYIVKTVIYMDWMTEFRIYQSTKVLGIMIAITLIMVWRNGKNRMLEYLLLLVSIFGARLYHETIKQTFSYLQSIGFVGKFHSNNFPDLSATLMFIIYGTCLFLLVRHSKKTITSVLSTLIGLISLMGLTIANIALTSILPSDILGGYVYGGVWIFFNFLLFEMLRLVLEKYKIEMV